MIQIERDNTMTLKGDNNLLRRKHDLFVSEYEGLAETVAEKDKEISKLKKKVQDLEEAVVWKLYGTFSYTSRKDLRKKWMRETSRLVRKKAEYLKLSRRIKNLKSIDSFLTIKLEN